MNENLNPERHSISNIDLELDKALRPKQFDDFSGQPKVVENLKVFVMNLRVQEPRTAKSGSTALENARIP